MCSYYYVYACSCYYVYSYLFCMQTVLATKVRISFQNAERRVCQSTIRCVVSIQNHPIANCDSHCAEAPKNMYFELFFQEKHENICTNKIKPLPLHRNSEMKRKKVGSVAQLNRASDYGSEGYGFESHRSHEKGLNVFIQSFFHIRMFLGMSIV